MGGVMFPTDARNIITSSQAIIVIPSTRRVKIGTSTIEKFCFMKPPAALMMAMAMLILLAKQRTTRRNTPNMQRAVIPSPCTTLSYCRLGGKSSK